MQTAPFAAEEPEPEMADLGQTRSDSKIERCTNENTKMRQGLNQQPYGFQLCTLATWLRVAPRPLLPC